jgi:hypothetical protein
MAKDVDIWQYNQSDRIYRIIEGKETEKADLKKNRMRLGRNSFLGFSMSRPPSGCRRHIMPLVWLKGKPLGCLSIGKKVNQLSVFDVPPKKPRR